MNDSYANPSTFLWTDLPIISRPFTFREFFSKPLCSHIINQDILDHHVSTFQYVPCTGIYTFSDESDTISIFVSIGTNSIEEITYNNSEYRYCIQFMRGNRMTVRKCVIEPFTCVKEETITFQDEEANTISMVSQDILDSVRVECEGRQYTINAEQV